MYSCYLCFLCRVVYLVYPKEAAREIIISKPKTIDLHGSASTFERGPGPRLPGLRRCRQPGILVT